jgi:hypothetical protein
MMMNGRYQPPLLPHASNYATAPFINQYPNQLGHMAAAGYNNSSLHHANANGRNMFPQQIPPIRVQFEQLAFYEFLSELCLPIKLIGNGNSSNSRLHSLSFNFIMSTEQGNEITSSR